MKITKEIFIERVHQKHPNKELDFSKSEFTGLEKPITYYCKDCNQEVTQIAKKVLTHTGCPLCDSKKAKKSRQSGKYQRNKGHNYELKIAKELIACGYPNVVTSRSESKRIDDQKVDLIDLDNKLPILIQCKATKNVPNFFKIKNACKRDKPFTLFWSRQEVKEGQVNMSSAGELVMVDKDFFYELLKHYNGHNF